MKKLFQPAWLAAALLAVTGAAWAHHGSNISYDTSHLWSTWATVSEFSYQNPHPTLKFTRTTKDGQVENWVAELLTNPSVLARSGWTRGRSNDALKPTTRVKLYIGSSRAGGFSGIVMRIENEKGEAIVGDRRNVEAVDRDGVPGSTQHGSAGKLPGQT